MKQQVLTNIIEKASKIWAVPTETLNGDTVFADMNPKSTHYSQITTFLEDKFDVEIPYMDFRRCKTLGEAARYVADLLEA